MGAVSNAKTIIGLSRLALIHAGMVVHEAWVKSPTLDEVAHLAAGLSHVEFGTFDLYRVNPPLRLPAGLSLTLAGTNMSWSEYYVGIIDRREFDNGANLAHLNVDRYRCLVSDPSRGLRRQSGRKPGEGDIASSPLQHFLRVVTNLFVSQLFPSQHDVHLVQRQERLDHNTHQHQKKADADRDRRTCESDSRGIQIRAFATGTPLPSPKRRKPRRAEACEKAPPGFEPGMVDLQSTALGHLATAPLRVSYRPFGSCDFCRHGRFSGRLTARHG